MNLGQLSAKIFTLLKIVHSLQYLCQKLGTTDHSKGGVLLQVGTGRFRRSHKYHDKNVDRVWVADNGYMVTGSTGSKFVKIWKVTTA